MVVSAAGICTSFAITAGSSGMTVPYAVEDAGASVLTDSGEGEASWVARISAVGELTGGGTLVVVSSGGGAQLARIEFAAIKLPVTDVISLSASRRDNRPSV